MESSPFPHDFLGLALIDAPLDAVVADAQQWLTASVKSQVPFEVQDMRPYANRTEGSYGYFWSPLGKPDGTTLIANVSIVHNLARRFKHRVLEVRVSPVADEWPICEMQLSEGGCDRRFIRAFRGDTRWEFYERG